VLAINDLLRSVRTTLEAEGITDRTYVVFSSDNGYHLGEHRLISGKRTAFDHDIKVPLMVVGPGVKPKTDIAELSANIDLAPTFLQMASVQPPARTDGTSLLGLMRGDHPDTWRDDLLVEYYKPLRGPFYDPDVTDLFVHKPPNYHALRTGDALYVENRTREREFYDLATDPLELHNRYRELGKAERQRLHGRLLRLESCAGSGCRPPPP
jgi:arylsulfatase A-like enzyme